MDRFKRIFAVERFAEHRTNSGLAALLDRWVLPGEDAGAYGLRLAIRNGYLNLYVKGQSVGEIRLVRGLPRLRLHRKYKSLVEFGSASESGIGQTYDVVDANALAKTGPDTIDDWIRTAETYAGDEKRFVDDLIAVTPGTIDMEMGLPADSDAVGNERTAPRMDLVVAQGTEIAFWEAKCAMNGELRSNALYSELPDGGYRGGQHVLWQLRRYQRWINRDFRAIEVREAYIEAARLLLELAEMFSKRGHAIKVWRDFVDSSEKVSVILPPGIVVAGYCPSRSDGRPRPESSAYAAKLKSFGKHSARLCRHGATVVTVNAKPNCPALPVLRPGLIRPIEDEEDTGVPPAREGLTRHSTP